MKFKTDNVSIAKRAYGVHRKEHLKDYYKQNGRCAICSVPIEFNGGYQGAALDHCHTSNEFRGFLCGMCNKGLGMFKDNPEVLKNAAEYISKHRDTSVFWKKLKSL